LKLPRGIRSLLAQLIYVAPLVFDQQLNLEKLALPLVDQKLQKGLQNFGSQK
jgi:hypothetical protein